MKSKQFAAFTVVLFAIGASLGHSQTVPAKPTGTLKATPEVVAPGTNPTLTWSISYPPLIEEYIRRDDGGGETTSITPIIDLLCDVRILGMGVTSKDSTGKITYYKTKGMWKYNNASSWATIYEGFQTDLDVSQQRIVKSSILVKKDQRISFAGQYYNSSWKTMYTSTDTTTVKNIRILVSGDVCPGNIPDYNAPSLELFLKPYLDTARKIKIGPMDVIVIGELTHTDTTNVGYDLQDLVMLFTFRKP